VRRWPMAVVYLSRSKPRIADSRQNNRLLAALPAQDWERLRAHSREVPARLRQLIHTAGDPLTHVYFPTGGVFSVTVLLSDGTSVESAIVGNDGMLGVEAFFTSSPVVTAQTLLRAPTERHLIQVPTDPFRRELAKNGALKDVITRYAQMVFTHMMQSAACHAVHSLRQRVARSLLLTHDRVDGDTFYLSQAEDWQRAKTSPYTSLSEASSTSSRELNHNAGGLVWQRRRTSGRKRSRETRR
jgi:CRP-like cAMP-binding protein